MKKITMGSIKVNDVYSINSGTTVTILEVNSYSNILIKHNDEFGHIAKVDLGNLNKGEIKNPYTPSIHGVGYLGVGPYKSSINGRHTLEYNVWGILIARVYGTNSNIRFPTYHNTTMCKEWLNFQNFADWYCNNGYYGMGYELDKDILYPGNRHYSPSTCCMVPKYINNLISTQKEGNLGYPRGVSKNNYGYMATLNGKYIGNYATVEEASRAYEIKLREYVLIVIEEWKLVIDERVYDALMDFSTQM